MVLKQDFIKSIQLSKNFGLERIKYLNSASNSEMRTSYLLVWKLSLLCCQAMWFQAQEPTTYQPCNITLRLPSSLALFLWYMLRSGWTLGWYLDTVTLAASRDERGMNFCKVEYRNGVKQPTTRRGTKSTKTTKGYYRESNSGLSIYARVIFQLNLL